MPRVEYPFYNFQTATDALRVYLPIRLSNPDAGISTDIEMALVDTGADSCVIPGSLADALGHNLKHKTIKPSPTLGINGTHVDTYGHTFRLELLGPDAETVVWSNDNAVIDCIDAEVPILLGTKDFLAGFKITIDYPAQKVVLHW
jgi:predicted aspartyl protease